MKPIILINLLAALLLLAGCDASIDKDAEQNTTPPTETPKPPAVTPDKPALPPTIANVDTWAVEGLPFHYQLATALSEIEDADINNAIFSSIDLPAWASLDAKTGEISGTPTAADVTAKTIFQVKMKQEDDAVIIFNGSMAILHSAALASSNKIDFYDTPFDEHPRFYRNDLEGALKGEVQFVQTHSMAPERKFNYYVNPDDHTKSQYMPSTIALREALILFMPEESVDPITVDLVVSSPNKPEITLSMAHPNDLPTADRTTVLTYSKRAWSAVLPYDYVVNGLALEFVVDKDNSDTALSGALPAERIDIDRATEAVFFSTRVGFLTPAPLAKDSGYWSLEDPVLSATDYFQTLPASKIVFASYDDHEFTQTIVNTPVRDNSDPSIEESKRPILYWKARVYDKDIDKHSDTEGSVYSGDMRENVGKSQVSVGINLANSGITSWDISQTYPKAQYLMTSHHVHGMYKCDPEANANCPEEGYWRVEHGLSGGNGIATIAATYGNLASHEWGHAYGLGHWPGMNLTSDCRWSDHHATTGWGFISHRNRLRNSVYGIANEGDSRETCAPISGQPHPRVTYSEGQYKYSRDAMSGGNEAQTPLSRYTFYGSYSARLIQQYLNNWYIPDTDYSSGYKQWDNETGDYQEVLKPTLDGKPAPVPTHVGVPVVTILGGYDPDSSKYSSDDEKRAVIYPAFYANYGNLYNLPAPDLSDDQDHCWVEVKNAAGDTQLVEVLHTRNKNNQSNINQLHFNLEQSFKPTSATLNCRQAGSILELAHTEFDGVIPELPPLAIVGQEHGTKQLMMREMQEIEEGILALAPDNVMQADANLLIKIQSYDSKQLAQHLEPSVWAYVEELLSITQSTARIGAVINYHNSKSDNAQTLKQALAGYLIDTKLASDVDTLLPKASVMYGHWNSGAAAGTAYLSTVPAEDGRLYVKPVEDSEEARQEMEMHRWVMDKQGRIHPERDLSLCLVATGPITLQACDPKSVGQKWAYNDNQTLQANGGTGQCIDNYASQGNHLNMYGCTGNWNQKWNLGEKNEAAWLAFSDKNVIQQVLSILAQQLKNNHN